MNGATFQKIHIALQSFFSMDNIIGVGLEFWPYMLLYVVLISKISIAY